MIPGQIMLPVEPGVGPVHNTEPAVYNDPVEPWAEPRPWPKPTLPTAVPSPRSMASGSPPRQELPLGLNGFCPVQLVENEAWVKGDSRLAVEHRGRVYLMSGANRRQRFLTNPDRYAPVMAGNDTVLAVDEGRQEPGQTDHCVVYDGRLYSFSSLSTLNRFRRDPECYAASAERPPF